MTFAGRASAVDSERGLVIPGSIVAGICRRLRPSESPTASCRGGCDEEVDDVCTAIDFRLRGRVPRVCRRCAERTRGRAWSARACSRTSVYFDFSRTDTGIGAILGRAPIGAPVSLSGIELGHSVRFEFRRWACSTERSPGRPWKARSTMRRARLVPAPEADRLGRPAERTLSPASAPGAGSAALRPCLQQRQQWLGLLTCAEHGSSVTDPCQGQHGPHLGLASKPGQCFRCNSMNWVAI